jgi:hypothetical protein
MTQNPAVRPAPNEWQVSGTEETLGLFWYQTSAFFETGHTAVRQPDFCIFTEACLTRTTACRSREG